MTTAERTIRLLEIMGLVNGTTTWKGTYANMPDEMPDERVAVYNDGQQDDGRSLRPPYTFFRHQKLLFRVRARTNQAAEEKALEIAAALSAVHAQEEEDIGDGGTVFCGFYRLDGPHPNGRTENNQRWVYSFTMTTNAKDLT